MKFLKCSCMMILCLFLFSAPTFAESSFARLFYLLTGQDQKQEMGAMTHAETVAALRDLGIDVPDETVQEVEQSRGAMGISLDAAGVSRCRRLRL